jgi:hypothetical protein
VEPAHLTTDEENVVGAIASLEARGEPTSLATVAQGAGLSTDATRSVLSRLLGELGVVQEVEGDDLGPYYVISGRGGTQTSDAPEGALQLENVAEQLQRSLGDQMFPATTEAVVAHASDPALPQPLAHAIKGLPPGQTFLSLQDLVSAVKQQLSG